MEKKVVKVDQCEGEGSEVVNSIYELLLDGISEKSLKGSFLNLNLYEI